MANEEGTQFKDTILGKIPKEWNICQLGDLTTNISYGYTASATEDRVGPKFLRITDIVHRSINWDKVPFCKIYNKEKYELKEGDIVIARTGASTGSFALIDKDYDAVFASYLIRFRFDKSLISPLYVSYVLHSHLWTNFISASIKGSAQPGINAKELSDFLLPVPSLLEQQRIGNFLKTFDSKIELNQKMNKTLEAIAQAIFKHWFIDFEFPNEEGKPYKSSGGEMVDSELGKIPKGWKIGKLKDVALNLDSKRIPLSSREREKRRGVFPYYGAASVLDYVDAYIFDGIYLLIGEDGTVTDEQGHPILQYVSGKFWVNNHAHVIQGKFPFSTEYLYLFLRQRTVRHLVTGAVQAKINQENLNGIPLVIPPEDILYAFNKFSEILFSRNRLVINQINTLSLLLKTLLPKLISGKIRVPLEE